MNARQQELADKVRQLASEFPLALVEGLADAIEASDPSSPGSPQAAVEAAVPQAHYRAIALSLVELWRRYAPGVHPHSLAFALLAAGRCEEFARKNQRLELVWTGPEVEAVPPRRTEQALLQLIDSAKTTLTVVSFVAYKVPLVGEALAEAARRGVTVRLIVEDPDVSQGKVAFDAMNAFGPDVIARSSVYVWPLDKRPLDGTGNHGSLHAKCAVADARHLLISSANLTEHAFTLNMELGILIRGGDLPARVETYFTSLIEKRLLRSVLD
ncbi:MAG: DISARM system phospholipase D-like protein DrmC [Candidatus Rokuibacteriota bacterium]